MWAEHRAQEAGVTADLDLEDMRVADSELKITLATQLAAPHARCPGSL